MKKQPTFPIPTKLIVERYLTASNNDERFTISENALTSLLSNYSTNNDINSIILKTTAINSLYSTNIYSVIEMAQHILRIEFDSKIKKMSTSIVDDIASGHGIVNSKNGKEFRFYSFATKYCSWHCQTEYPIFDTYIEFVLKNYNHKNVYTSDNNFKDYNNFKNTILLFRKKHSLEEFSLKQIDKFLWQLGKDYFKQNDSNE